MSLIFIHVNGGPCFPCPYTWQQCSRPSIVMSHLPLSLVTRWQQNECHWKPQVGPKLILPRLSEGWLASPVTFVVTNFQLCGTVVCVWSTPAAWGQHRFVHRMGWLQSKQSDMSAWKTNLSSTNQLETSLAQYQGGREKLASLGQFWKNNGAKK